MHIAMRPRLHGDAQEKNAERERRKQPVLNARGRAVRGGATPE